MAKKISLSSGVVQLTYGDHRALEILAESGFDGVDLNVDCYGRGVLPDIYSMSDDEFEEYFTSVKAKADEVGIVICQTHNLCSDLYTADPERNRAVLKKCERGLKANQILGCPLTVIHCISSADWGKDANPELMHRENQRMFGDIISIAEKYGITVAMESFGACHFRDGSHGPDFFADPDKMLYEFDSLKTENKAFCFDCGHTNNAMQFGFIDTASFVRLFGRRIKLLHLHDNDGILDQHLIPRQSGTVKWPELFEALEEIGYDGYYNYELRLRYGNCLEDMVRFLGKFLREFTDRMGRI